MTYDRELLQQVFCRIAKDSNFAMDATEVAAFGARMLQCSPLEFWIALGYDNMTSIANGTHTAVKKVSTGI